MLNCISTGVAKVNENLSKWGLKDYPARETVAARMAHNSFAFREILNIIFVYDFKMLII